MQQSSQLILTESYCTVVIFPQKLIVITSLTNLIFLKYITFSLIEAEIGSLFLPLCLTLWKHSVVYYFLTTQNAHSAIHRSRNNFRLLHSSPLRKLTAQTNHLPFGAGRLTGVVLTLKSLLIG